MSLKQNLAANYLGQAWSAIVGLAFLPLYVRYLGNEALGLIGVFTLLQAWLTLLDFGITPTMNREMARFTAGGHSTQSIADLVRSLETVALAIAAVTALAIWGAADFLARSWLQAQALPIEVVAQALAVMGLVLALRFVEGIYRGALLGLQRQVFLNIVNAVMATLRYGGAVVVLGWISPTIRAFYVWQAAVSVLAIAVFALSAYRSLPRPASPARVSRQALAGVRGFASGMLAISGLSLLVSQMDKLLLSRLLPLEEFGYYTLAATMGSVLTMIVAPILQSIFPALVQLATTDDRAGQASIYHQGAQLVSVATIPLMLVLTLFPFGVVFAWSGDPALAARTAPLLVPLAMGTFLNALMWMPYQSQLAHGWTSLTIRVNAVAVIVLVPAILWLVPRYGGQAAAWIWVTLNAAYVLIAIHFMHRRILLGEKRRWFLDDVGAPLGAAVVVAMLFGLFAPSSMNRLLWAVYFCLTGATLAAVAVLVADRLRPRVFLFLRQFASLQPR